MLTSYFCLAGGVMLCLQITQELWFFADTQQTPTGNSEFYDEKVSFPMFFSFTCIKNSYCVALFGAFVLGDGLNLKHC